MFRDPACSIFRKILVGLVFGVGVLLIPHGVQSATSNSATLQWAANQESDLAGYRIYHGTTSGNYGSSQNIGNTSSYQYANLESNKTHYFSITAYDFSGNESNPSSEVSTFMQAPDPPSLTNPTPNSMLGGSTATFTWEPNETSVIEWWLYVGTSQGALDILDTGSLGTSLSTTVTGLSTDGSQIWVQLWYKPTSGTWESRHYQFTAAGSSISSFPLTITKSGDGTGTITSNPVALNCGSTCTASFSADSPITLSANVASDSIFSGWSGGGCSGTGSCVLTLSSSTSVSANFASSPPPSHSLGVTLAGDGSGMVSSSPTGISCSTGTCSGTFPQDTSVTLSAAPSGGSTFSGWGGACTGTGSCTLTLVSSATVSTTFSSSTPPVSHTLGVSLTGDGKGSVTSAPSGLACSEGTCTAIFPQGTTVILTPTTESGSQFQGWNGVCSGTSSCSVTLSSPQVVTAVFVTENSNPPPSPEFPMSVNFQPSSSEIPPDFIKDDGSVFSSSRGYGWDVLVNSKERNAQVEQTIDTFVQTANKTPVTWNCTLPNGTYYISMVMGDPRKKSGPHSLSLEGMQLAAQIKTGKGQYFSIVEYPVNIQDNTLSITLGGGGKGATLLNFVMINSSPSLTQTMQALTQSFGTDLLAGVASSGTMAKINPKQLMKQENHRQRVLAKIQRFLAKIERKLVKYADKPRKMARLNKKKERLLAKLDKIQESRQPMN